MPRCQYCGQRTRTPHAHAKRRAGSQSDITGLYPPLKPFAEPGYALEGVLGEGGFGTVYRARRERDGASVAIKVARGVRHAADQRLTLEAHVLRTIGPPWVPEVYDTSETADGTPYLVMELIEYPTLAQLMEDNTPLSVDDFHELAGPLASAVGVVHQAGFVHRDLKPENIFIGGSPKRAYLIDFGLGQVTEGDDDELDISETGWVLGTVEYMAPEQCQPDGALDHRADIYALGVLFYELLSGRPPFFGSPKTVRLALQVRRPPPLIDIAPVPVPLAVLVMRCLAKQPDQRFASADELLAALSATVEASVRQSGRGKTRLSRSKTRRAAVDMPVVYFRSREELGEVRAALSRYGCTLANVEGDRYVGALSKLSGESPVERAKMAAEGLVDMGICTAAIVDFTKVRRRVGPDGSLRHRSAAFSREHVYPEVSDQGVFLTDEALQALPTRVQVPLIGRDDIVDQLVTELTTAIGAHAPIISTVVGPGGYGKSALAARMEELIAKEFPDVSVLSIRASLPLGGDSHATLRQLACWLFGLPENATEEPPNDYLGAKTLLNILGESLANELAPALAMAMGWIGPEHPIIQDIAAAPGALRSTIVRLVGEGLRRRAEKEPVAVIIDDVHMADDSTLDAIEYACLEDLRLPLWVCVLGRPTFESARPAWGARAGHHLRLELEPLDADSAAELCRQLLKPAENVPERVISALVMRSQSIPLLLVELVQGLKRDRIVRQHKGSQVWFVASDELDRLSGMPLLNWLAQAELSALPADLAAHARLAALLGDGFRAIEMAATLREVEKIGLGADFPLDANAGLASLRALGMLIGTDGGQLRFRHVLLREAIVQMLPKERRREMHFAAFAAYRTVAPMENADYQRLVRLAYHAAQAELGERAFDLYLNLADQMRDAHDYVSAERHYTSALDTSGAGDRVLLMRAIRGRALMRYRVGRYEESLEDFTRACNLAVEIGDREAEIQILLDEATALDWSDRHKQSSKQVFRAQLKAEGVVDSSLIRARLHLGVGRSQWRGGKLNRARERLEQAVALSGVQGPEGYETLAGSRLALGCVLAAQGEMDAANEVFELVVELCEERGDLFHLAAALNNRRYVWMARGDIEHIITDAERCIGIGRQLGIMEFEVSANYNVAELLYQRGEIESAWPYVDRAIRCEERRAAAVGAGRPLARLLKARMLCYTDQRERARHVWRALREYNDQIAKERLYDRSLKSDELVLLEMVDLFTRPSTISEWNHLLMRSEDSKLSSLDLIELFEMTGLWAQHQNDTEAARKYLRQALSMTQGQPSVIKYRIQTALGQLNPAAVIAP